MPIRWNVPQREASLEQLYVALGEVVAVRDQIAPLRHLEPHHPASSLGGAVVLEADGVANPPWPLNTSQSPLEYRHPLGYQHPDRARSRPAPLATRRTSLNIRKQTALWLAARASLRRNKSATRYAACCRRCPRARRPVDYTGVPVSAGRHGPDDCDYPRRRCPEASATLCAGGLLKRIDSTPPGTRLQSSELAEVDESIADLLCRR